MPRLARFQWVVGRAVLAAVGCGCGGSSGGSPSSARSRGADAGLSIATSFLPSAVLGVPYAVRLEARGARLRTTGRWRTATGFPPGSRWTQGTSGPHGPVSSGRVLPAPGPARATHPRLLSGDEQPGNAAECLDVGLVCWCRKDYAASCRFYARAFEESPDLAMGDLPCPVRARRRSSGRGGRRGSRGRTSRRTPPGPGLPPRRPPGSRSSR
jgi:hypothetical protein